MEKILPFKIPDITTSPVQTGVLAVILQDEKAYSWYYSNLIQIYSLDIFRSLGYYNDLFYRICPIIHRRIVPRSILRSLEVDIVDFYIKCINDEQYILAMMNGIYISAYKYYYQKIHFNHGMLLFGYNCKEQIFYFADFVNGAYSVNTATFDEIRRAYKSTDRGEGLDYVRAYDYIDGVNLLQFNDTPFIFNQNRFYDFNIPFVKHQLNCYLSSKDPYEHMGVPMDNTICGMNVYKELISNLELLDKGELEFGMFGQIPFHVIWNHKALMVERLNYMVQNNYLENGENEILKYKELEHLALINRNLFLKTRLSKNRDGVRRIIDNLKKITEDEVKVIKSLLSKI